MENNLKSSFQIGKLLFFTSLFLLPSALSAAAFLLIISIFISFSSNYLEERDDKINLILYTACIFLFVSSTINFFRIGTTNNSYLTFVGLLNWIPHIILFVGCQKYIITSIDRKRCVIALILGSIPILFSCFSQSFLNWHGPFRTLFGLIVWYQKPLDGFTGITGLFSNPNYLGAWLNIIWPFCIAFLFFENRNIAKVILKLIFCVLVSIIIILTASRGAWICLVITLPLMFGFDIKKRLLSFLLLLSIIPLNLAFPIFGVGFQDFLRQIIPKGIWINLTSSGYESLDISRTGIWQYALRFIADKPILGHGSNAFPTLFENATNLWKGHTHSLPLELMVNYGVPTALLLLIPVTYLIYKSYLKVFLKESKINSENIIDRAWVVALSIQVLTHLVDIQYFDGRISIIGWVLLAGSRNIILNSSENNKRIKIFKN